MGSSMRILCKLFCLVFFFGIVSSVFGQGKVTPDTGRAKAFGVDEYQQILQTKRETTSTNVEKSAPTGKPDTIRKVVVIKSVNPQTVPAGTVLIKKPILVKENYAGFNTAPLLNQFVPFNALDPSKQLMSVNFRRYVNNKGYRLGLGSNLEVDGDIQSFSFKYDSDKRREMSGGKFLYNMGYGFGFEYFQDNTDNSGFFFDMNGFVDFIFALHWGIEYKINPIVSLSTEASWQLRLGTTGGMRIVPPLAIIANFKIDKMANTNR